MRQTWVIYVQCELLGGANQYTWIETKEDAQAYALEIANESDKRKYQYYVAKSLYSGASVSLRSGLTLEEAKQRIMYWGDVWAVDEAAAIHLCNELGGISNEGATRDNDPGNALRYHVVMSLKHYHIFFGLDKNLIFIP